METYRPGSLMFVSEDGQEQIAQPGDALFSTVTMVATHYWSEGVWRPIFEDELGAEPAAPG